MADADDQPRAGYAQALEDGSIGKETEELVSKPIKKLLDLAFMMAMFRLGQGLVHNVAMALNNQSPLIGKAPTGPAAPKIGLH